MPGGCGRSEIAGAILSVKIFGFNYDLSRRRASRIRLVDTGKRKSLRVSARTPSTSKEGA
jgi:hypothetical protein